MPETTARPKKAWTVLVFMAGDNDMEHFGELDLVEMSSLPSDEHVYLLVQFDSLDEPARRYRFFPGWYERIGEPLGEINCGDPASLTQFVNWGKAHFPAEHTALVIWNHGTGLRDLPDDFDYSTLRSSATRVVKEEMRRTMFTPTLSKMAATRSHMRGVAVDATDRDYLDNVELQTALADVSSCGPCVDLIGFDACLMNVVEIAYQLRGLARVMVGSQEVEPGRGWPYHLILEALTAEPGMSAHELAKAIVCGYGEATKYAMQGPDSLYTQSALDLDHVRDTYHWVKELSQELLKPQIFDNVKRDLSKAHKEVHSFHDRDLVDLVDWCEWLDRRIRGVASESLWETLEALRDHLKLGKEVIVANHAHGKRDPERSHGLSIYWPEKTYSTVYDGLDFASSGWGQLAKKVTGLR